jgi:hypothetical protein
MHGPVPACPHDLCQTLSVVLVRLVDLHLEGRTGMPGIKADHLKLSPAQLVDQPGRHGACLDPDRRSTSRMPSNDLLDLFWIRRALAAPQPTAGVIHNADRCQLLRNVQAYKPGH